MVSRLKTSKNMDENEKKAVIYSGRHQLYFDQRLRLVDTFNAVINQGMNLIVNVHLSPTDDCYETSGKNLAEILATKGVESFEIRNSYLYDSLRGCAIRVVNFEGMNDFVCEVPPSKLGFFRRGLLSKLRGAII